MIQFSSSSEHLGLLIVSLLYVLFASFVLSERKNNKAKKLMIIDITTLICPFSTIGNLASCGSHSHCGISTVIIRIATSSLILFRNCDQLLLLETAVLSNTTDRSPLVFYNCPTLFSLVCLAVLGNMSPMFSTATGIAACR